MKFTSTLDNCWCDHCNLPYTSAKKCWCIIFIHLILKNWEKKSLKQKFLIVFLVFKALCKNKRVGKYMFKSQQGNLLQYFLQVLFCWLSLLGRKLTHIQPVFIVHENYVIKTNYFPLPKTTCPSTEQCIEIEIFCLWKIKGTDITYSHKFHYALVHIFTNRKTS